MRPFRKGWIAAGVVLGIMGVVSAETIEERLTRLEELMAQQSTEREAALLQRVQQLEAQVKELEGQQESGPDAPSAEVAGRLSDLENQIATMAADQAANPLDGLSLGGYGELHYNALRGSGGAADKREIDFHRFVLMVGKDFNERIRLRTELELEHALSGDGEPGEVELEQAYIDFDLNDRHTARAGLFLLPVGLLNTTHEPTRFYGVERNPVENQILPTTWWEGGAGLYGRLSDSVSYEAYVHSGFETSAASSYSVRSGRQKVANASADDPAGTVALSWSVPGITLGGSAQYQVDMTQGAETEAVAAWMGEAHLDLQKGPLGLRMLYAEWNLDGDGPEAVGADRQFGWYVEPSYLITDSLGLFVRYNQWDNLAGTDASDSRKEQANVGINWWPHEQVVVKADYQWQFNENDADQDGLNLGLGYEF